MKKIISMVLFTGVVLLSPTILSNVSHVITVEIPTYKIESKPIEYYIVERKILSEKPNVQTENTTQTEPLQVNISPMISAKIINKNTEKSEVRYKPTANERKLMAALAWREDHSSVESMMAVVEVVLNRLESDVYSFSKLKNVEDVIFQAGWIKGSYVEQYSGAKKLYKVDPSDEAFDAVDRVCAGETVVGEKALFHAEDSVPSWKVANDIYIVTEVGETRFWGIEEGE